MIRNFKNKKMSFDFNFDTYSQKEKSIAKMMMLMVTLVVLTLESLVLVDGTSVKMDFLSAGLVRTSFLLN